MVARNRLRGALGLALFGAIVLAALAFGPERVVETLLALGESRWLFPLLLGLYFLRPFIGWPHGPFPTAAGFYFGFAGGTTVALVGLLVTSLPPFAVGRYLGDGMFSRIGDLGERLTGATGNVRAVVGARLLPLPADLVSYSAGVVGVPTKAFVLGTLIGDLPWILGLVFVGTQLETLTAEGIDALSPTVVVLLALIGLFVLAAPLYERLRA